MSRSPLPVCLKARAEAPGANDHVLAFRSLGIPSADRALLENFAASLPDSRLPLLTAAHVRMIFDAILEDVGAVATLDRDLWEQVYIRAGLKMRQLENSEVLPCSQPRGAGSQPRGDRLEDYRRLVGLLNERLFGRHAALQIEPREGAGVDEFWKRFGTLGELRLICRFLRIEDSEPKNGTVTPLPSPRQIGTILKNHFEDPHDSPITPDMLEELRRFSETRAAELALPNRKRMAGERSTAKDYRDLANLVRDHLREYSRAHSLE